MPRKAGILPRAIAVAIAVGAGLGVNTALAQSIDTSEWVCEFCPFESGHRASYDAGASKVSGDSAYFDDAAGYGKKGVVANLDGAGSYSSEGHRLEWTAEDLGLDSRFAGLNGGRPGKFDYQVSYREIPRRQFITTESIFVESGGSTLALPPGWVRAGSTAGFTALDTSLTNRDIESDRSIINLGGRYLLSDAWSFSADYRRQQQDGVDILGGSHFSTASLLPMPFDYVTDEVDLGVRYAAGQGFLSLAWYLSDFESDDAAFSWQSPFTTALGAESASIAQPPANRFQQLTVSGGYRFAQARTSVSFSASSGQIEQDDALLPYTSNPNLASGALPVSSLGGEVDTSNFAFSLTSRALDKARLNLSYRYDERDNKTSQEQWNRIITDTFLSNDIETNIPYSYQRSSLRASADYELFDSVRVSAGYDRREFDRDFQEVAEQTEDTGWGRVRWRPSALFDVNLKGGTSKRDIDRYNETVAVTFGQNPLMRKYNLAYRYREFGEVTVNAALPEQPISITLTGLVADDSYTKSRLGLLSADETRFSADINWAFAETGSLYVNGGVESIESIQAGSESFAAADWQANTEDRFKTFGVGVRLRQLTDGVSLQLDYNRSDGKSKIDVGSAPGGQSRFPDLESTLDYLRIKLTWQQSERMEFSVSGRVQRLETEDWALEGVGPATIPSVLTLGAEPYDEDVLIVGVSFRYSVGTARTAN
jgi:MtrB/PioB family decaheme-associated outer membrane protein